MDNFSHLVIADRYPASKEVYEALIAASKLHNYHLHLDWESMIWGQSESELALLHTIAGYVTRLDLELVALQSEDPAVFDAVPRAQYFTRLRKMVIICSSPWEIRTDESMSKEEEEYVTAQQISCFWTYANLLFHSNHFPLLEDLSVRGQSVIYAHLSQIRLLVQSPNLPSLGKLSLVNDSETGEEVQSTLAQRVALR